MSARFPPPAARWSCPDIGVPSFVRLSPDESRRWTRDDFADPYISRSGVSFEVIDGSWTVTNRSTSMRDVYLLDVRYGRRQIPPTGSLRPMRLRSWVLLPSSRGHELPHVVAMAIETPPAPAAVLADSSTDQHTENAGEPNGRALRHGLRRCQHVLADRAARDLIALYARPYFTVSTEAPAPTQHRQVATCLPGDASRGERLLTQMRTALWGRASGQAPDLLIELLIRHGIVTQEHIGAVRHAPGCGHDAAQLDPTAPFRRGATAC